MLFTIHGIFRNSSVLYKIAYLPGSLLLDIETVCNLSIHLHCRKSASYLCFTVYIWEGLFQERQEKWNCWATGHTHWQITLWRGCTSLLCHIHHRTQSISLNACHHPQTVRGWPTQRTKTVSHCCLILPHHVLKAGGQLHGCYLRQAPPSALFLAPATQRDTT